MGVRSLNSVRAYAHDILTWLRFLEERRGSTSIWQADRQDVIAFHRARRLVAGPGQISASSWNRCVTALEKFYTWAWDENLSPPRRFCAERWPHRAVRRRHMHSGAPALSGKRLPGHTTCASSTWNGSSCSATSVCALATRRDKLSHLARPQR